MDIPPITIRGAEPGKVAEPTQEDLRAKEAAKAFEAAYLSEMLKYSGINETSSGFGGGAGEEAFSSLLTDEYARLMSERGGIGLAEHVFEILKQRATEK